MFIKYLSTLVSFILLSSNNTPISDNYTIGLPTHLDLTDQGSFEVKLIDNQINDAHTIKVSFDSNFYLKDLHGKSDIIGTINNNTIMFDKNNLESKQVSYYLSNTGVGEYSGNLNANISIDVKQETNVLLSGPNINQILSTINPRVISFSHNTFSSDYAYDLSAAQDESILLYLNNDEVIITNKTNTNIKTSNDLSKLFYNLNSLEEINNLNYLDTSNCENMSSMFEYCDQLKTIDVSSFNTSSVKDMSYMFSNIQNCTSIGDITNWDVSNVSNFSHFLNDDKKLTTFPADFSKWKVSNKCTDTSYMFNCVGYTPGKLNKSIWPTSEINLSDWDVSNVIDMSYMFKNAFKLTTLNISGWNTSKVKNMSNMFEMYDKTDKGKLTTIIGIDSIDVSNVKDMSNIFYSCRAFSANLSNWKPLSVTNISQAFYDNRSLNLHDFDSWDQYFPNIQTLIKDDVFGSYAGLNYDETYRPQWSK